MDKYKKFRKAIFKAYAAAQQAKTEADTDACAFDFPVIFYREMGYEKERIADIIENAGFIALEPLSEYLEGCILIGDIVVGQSSCRTKTAEAFVKALKKDGIKSGIYYQPD